MDNNWCWLRSGFGTWPVIITWPSLWGPATEVTWWWLRIEAGLTVKPSKPCDCGRHTQLRPPVTRVKLTGHSLEPTSVSWVCGHVPKLNVAAL